MLVTVFIWDDCLTFFVWRWRAFVQVRPDELPAVEVSGTTTCAASLLVIPSRLSR